MRRVVYLLVAIALSRVELRAQTVVTDPAVTIRNAVTAMVQAYLNC